MSSIGARMSLSSKCVEVKRSKLTPSLIMSSDATQDEDMAALAPRVDLVIVRPAKSCLEFRTSNLLSNVNAWSKTTGWYKLNQNFVYFEASLFIYRDYVAYINRRHNPDKIRPI